MPKEFLQSPASEKTNAVVLDRSEQLVESLDIVINYPALIDLNVASDIVRRTS
jgi:hypothetical protein